MKFFVTFTLLCLLPVLITCMMRVEEAKFDNYRVYKLRIDTHVHLNVLKELRDTSDSYNFLDEPIKVGSEVHVVVAPHKFAEINEIVQKFKLHNEITVQNLQKIIDNESKTRKMRKSGKASADDMNWDDYHDYETMYAWIDSLVERYPGIVSVEEIGKTHEGRPIRVVKISKNPGNPAIFIESNIHAREWITSATSTYLINELLTSNESQIIKMSQDIDWYINPMLNIDGHVYTRTTNRLWRKTRKESSLLCFGADANRNFEFGFLENGGSSSNPCSDTYAGPEPFSEVEALTIENYLKAHPGRFSVYLSFHSFGPYLLFPYGNQEKRAENFDDLELIGNKTAERLEELYGTQYVVGSTYEALYTASGVSVDHAYEQHGIKIAYTYEMRGGEGTGSGFILKPEFIKPNGREVVQSLVALVEESDNLGYLHAPVGPTN